MTEKQFFSTKKLFLPLYPTTNGGMQNGSSLHTHLHTFGTNLYAQSVLINKISSSELSWKFIKSALLVGYSSKFFLKQLDFFLTWQVAEMVRGKHQPSLMNSTPFWDLPSPLPRFFYWGGGRKEGGINLQKDLGRRPVWRVNLWIFPPSLSL